MDKSSESEELTKRAKDIETVLRKTINAHGYGFQYAVLEKICSLHREEAPWLFEVSEFPVEGPDNDTRIDFILRPRGKRLFLVAECKKVSSPLANWCFVRVPRVTKTRNLERLFVERVVVEESGTHGVVTTATVFEVRDIEDAYHLHFELKHWQNGAVGGKEPNHGGGRKTIENAAAQICRGMNGLVSFLSRLPGTAVEKNGGPIVTTFLPVIFTNAKLWVTEIDISEADLENGALPADPMAQVKQAPWVFLQYAQSPGLKHSVPRQEDDFEFADVLDKAYTRTIAVVGTSGIEPFLEFVMSVLRDLSYTRVSDGRDGWSE